MKKNIFLSILIPAFLFICISACAPAQTITVKPEKFERLMNKSNTIIVDVRTPEEFNTGHIPGAINIDVTGENFGEKIKVLDASKNYLLYCRTGRRSETALQIMIDNGFQNVRHLEGGIESWKGPKE
jgi:rhodanese-related sulfurtransferase